MLVSEDEEKIRKSQGYIDKYYVDSFYDYGTSPTIDEESIGRAKPIDLEHDGENFCGRDSAYCFDIYDTFEEACQNHHKRIDKVSLDKDGLSKEQIAYFEEYIRNCLSDSDYKAKYRM